MSEDSLKSAFPELNLVELEALASICTPHTFAVNDPALAETFNMRAGQPRTTLMVIESGEIEIFQQENGFQEQIAVLGPTEILGEKMLLEPDKPHDFSCRTLVRTQVLVISRDALNELLASNTQLAAKLYRQLAVDANIRLDRGRLPARHHTETDALGPLQIPDSAYYGTQTARAIQNFKITGIPISHFPTLIKSLAIIKKAAARANANTPNLQRRPNPDIESTVGDGIVRACDEIIEGNRFLHKQFLVDVIQGGAGTSTNMNANEVIAKRANELLGFPRYNPEGNPVDPNDDVNLAQSTNDVYPSALRLSLLLTCPSLIESLRALAEMFFAKGAEFADVLKMGRTQLQDAVPMTLGQEFHAFGVTLKDDIRQLENTTPLLSEINIGGTAIGTGILASAAYRERVIDEVNHILQNELQMPHLQVTPSPDLVEASWDTGAFVLLSGVLKHTAIKLSKICNDLRLLNSGPVAGFGDIRLPAVQAGSSIMPGKVNPVIPEVVNQVALQVIGNDLTISMAAEGGQLQLNPFEPIIAFKLVQSIQVLTRAMRTLCTHVEGISVTEQDKLRLRRRVEQNPGLATFLTPRIGYRAASRLVRAACETERSVKDLVLEQGLMTEAQWEDFMRPENLTRPYRDPVDNATPSL